MTDVSPPLPPHPVRRIALISAILAIVVVVVVAVRGSGSGIDPQLFYPDLVAVPPGQPALAVREWPEGSGDQRLLMRFDGVVANHGVGPLDVSGDPQLDRLVGGSLAQTIIGPKGEVLERHPMSVGSEGATVRFENSDGHNHWHLAAVAEYSMWDEARSSLVLPAAKIGFCLADVQPVIGIDGPEPPGVYPASNQCERDNPDATSLEMGISPGWADVYSFSLELQWIDITEASPGRYWLAGRADPEGLLVESDEMNEWVFGELPVVVPGYVAVDSVVRVSGATAFRVGAERFEFTVDETPDNAGDTQNDVHYPKGAPQFVVIEAPTHGSLSVDVGVGFEAPDITYVPEAGYVGADSFTFVAVDSGSPYPLDPVPATVSLEVTG